LHTTQKEDKETNVGGKILPSENKKVKEGVVNKKVKKHPIREFIRGG